MSLSAEAQHVINSLEAHFNAVKRAVEGASEDLIAHCEYAWDEAMSHLDAFRAKLEGTTGAGAAAIGTTGAALPGLSSSATGKPNDINGGSAAGAAPDQGSGGQDSHTEARQPGAETGSDSAAASAGVTSAEAGAGKASGGTSAEAAP